MSSLQWAPLARGKHLGQKSSQLIALMQAILHKLARSWHCRSNPYWLGEKLRGETGLSRVKLHPLWGAVMSKWAMKHPPSPTHSLLRGIPSEEYLLQKSEENHIFILFLISKAIWLKKEVSSWMRKEKVVLWLWGSEVVGQQSSLRLWEAARHIGKDPWAKNRHFTVRGTAWQHQGHAQRQPNSLPVEEGYSSL